MSFLCTFAESESLLFKKFFVFSEYIPDNNIVLPFIKRIVNNRKEEGIGGQLQSQLDRLVLKNKK